MNIKTNLYYVEFWKFKFSYFGILICIICEVFLKDIRNDWYARYLRLICVKNSYLKILVVQYLAIALAFFFIKFISNYFKTLFIAQKRNQIASQEYLPSNFAQKFTQDQELAARHFIECFHKLFASLGILMIFIPKIYGLVSLYVFAILSVCNLLYLFMCIFNTFSIKSFFQKYCDQLLEAEASLREFCVYWFDQNCINPWPFNVQKFMNTINKMKIYFYIKEFIHGFKEFFDSCILIFPIIFFYCWIEYSDYAQLMQISNIWSNINFAIQGLEEVYLEYLEFKTSNSRLQFKKYEPNFAEYLTCKDVTIRINEKILISKFNLSILPGEKVNIFAKSQSGKTTLMKAMQGYVSFEGSIKIPENILWIPEKILVPKDSKFENSCEFVKWCEYFEVDPNLYYENASGGQKWKLLASYSMLFDFVLWDDPFWGNYDIFPLLEKLKNESKTLIIFSQIKLEGFKNISLI